MADGIYTALTGAMVMDQNLEVLGNNLANISTPGYKGQRPVFQSVLVRQMGAQTASGGASPDRSDVEVADIGVDFTQGSLIETGSDLDLAISGDGFFVAQSPDGPVYTRRGLLSIDSERRLTVGGLPVSGEGGGDITIPEQSYLVVDPDGTVRAGEEAVGKIDLVSFADPTSLEPIGGGFFDAKGGAQPAEDAEVLQGFIENSNVNPVWGMTELIRTNRIFQAAEKAIKAYRDIDRVVATEVGRT